MEKNRVALPVIERGYGIRMPPEKYCLTGVNWELEDSEEFDYEEDEDDVDGDRMEGVVGAGSSGVAGGAGAGASGGGDNDEQEDEDGGEGGMDDLFGNDGGRDESMLDV